MKARVCLRRYRSTNGVGLALFRVTHLDGWETCVVLSLRPRERRVLLRLLSHLVGFAWWPPRLLNAATLRAEQEKAVIGSSQNETQELSTLIKETGNQIFEDHYFALCDLLDKVEACEYECSVPLEVWTGIAQALADASGYRIVLQAGIMEPVNDAPDTSRIIGHREIAIADPTLFIKRAREEGAQ